MPYVNIKVTQEGGPSGTGPSPEEKALLVAGVTDLLHKVLNKNPATTFVVIDEVPLDNWGMHGRQVSHIRAERSQATVPPPQVPKSKRRASAPTQARHKT